MKTGDIVWYFTAGHELKFGEIVKRSNGKYIIRDKNRMVRRRISQLAIKEERCKKQLNI